MATFERITCDDVKVGDRIGRVRKGAFNRVERIEEGAATRRLHFAREACPETEFSGTSVAGTRVGDHYCGTCSRWEDEGHGRHGGGNIRPRRTAQLWREIPTD